MEATHGEAFHNDRGSQQQMGSGWILQTSRQSAWYSEFLFNIPQTLTLTNWKERSTVEEDISLQMTQHDLTHLSSPFSLPKLNAWILNSDFCLKLATMRLRMVSDEWWSRADKYAHLIQRKLAFRWTRLWEPGRPFMLDVCCKSTVRSRSEIPICPGTTKLLALVACRCCRTA